MKINSDQFSAKGQALLSKLFVNSGEGIMFVGKDGSIHAVNPRSEELFGYKESELIGKTVEFLMPDHMRKRHNKYRDDYARNPTTRSMGTGRDLFGERKDGSTFPIEISLSPVEHEGELFVVAFITDISQRKKQEAILEQQRIQLEKHAEELELKVRQRTSELEHMNMGLQSQIHERKLAENALKKSLEDLRKAEKEILKTLEKERELNDLKSRFVSMASHEFRTPLTTILSSANLIAKYPETDQQAAREKHIERIKSSVQNLTSILNDFLSLEKLEAGVVELNIEEFHLREFIDELVQELSPTLKSGQAIISEVENTLDHLKSDPHLIKNILINLLSNARKYSDEQKTIWLKIYKNGREIIISVTDEGMGIPEADQRHLFGRFFRAANVTNIQGTGLGLNIVQRYADLLGAHLDFESREGQGSTFRLHIPVK
jgi:PAS domain S-box-containing protein